MARVMPMLVVFLVMAATKAATATDCMSVESSITPCSDFLRDPKMTAPGSYCCNSAGKLVHLGDVDSVCQCLKPFTSGFLSSQAKKLPQLCNIPGLSPLVPCLAPSSAKADQPDTFLPFGPFPPFPMTPGFAFPPFHFPSFVPPPPPHKA